MTVTRRWTVRGRVQGVGFRWFVQRRAQELGLCGFARNRHDGSVEVVARGDGPVLDTLEEALRIGPRFSQVDNVETEDLSHDIAIPNFFDTR